MNYFFIKSINIIEYFDSLHDIKLKDLEQYYNMLLNSIKLLHSDEFHYY